MARTKPFEQKSPDYDEDENEETSYQDMKTHTASERRSGFKRHCAGLPFPVGHCRICEAAQI